MRHEVLTAVTGLVPCMFLRNAANEVHTTQHHMPNIAILSWMFIVIHFVADFHLPVSDMFYDGIVGAQGKPTKYNKQL